MLFKSALMLPVTLAMCLVQGTTAAPDAHAGLVARNAQDMLKRGTADDFGLITRSLRAKHLSRRAIAHAAAAELDKREIDPDVAEFVSTMRGNVIDEYASKLRGSGSSHSKRASADDVDLIAGMRASVVDEYKSKMRADLAKRGVDAETAALIADIRGNVVDEYATKLRGASSLSKRDSSSSTIDDLSAYVSDMRGNVVDEYKAKLRGSTLSKRAIDSELADLVADMRGNVVDEMLQTIRAGGADSSDVAKRAERSEVAGARGAFVESMRKLVRGGGGGDKVKRDSVGAIQPTQLIDYWPMITSPSGGETFVAGQNASASWNQTLPSGIDREDVGDTANLVLGFKEEGSSSLNLYWTLAEDVPLWAPNDNEVTFTFPASLKARDTYIMVLVGSTSHTSAEFSILPAF